MSQQNSKEELERAIKQYVNRTGDGLTDIYKILNKQVKATKKLSASDRTDAIVEIIQAIFDTAAPAFNEMSADMFMQLTGFTASELLIENKALAEREIENAVRGIVSNSINTNNDVSVNDLWRFVHKNLRSGGRDMIVQAAKRHGKRFARVPRGKTCAWCTMVASQGFVYYTKETAGSMTKFHDHCDCDIIPESQADLAKAMGFDFNEARKQYQAAEKARRADPDGKNREADYYMRRLFPDAYTDGVKPALSTKGWKFPDIPKKGEPTSHNTRELFKRQKALRSETHRESLYEHEIAFIERMEKRGEALEWIPKKDSEPTNDFYWISRDMVACELKSPKKNKANTIKERISDAVKRAETHETSPIVKDVFVVDIGKRKPSPKLLWQLEKYNADRDKHKIRELWLLHSDGEVFQQINLL